MQDGGSASLISLIGPMYEMERNGVNEGVKRKGDSMIISTWPIRASVIKASAVFVRCSVVGSSEGVISGV